jgi:hypothetical protein
MRVEMFITIAYFAYLVVSLTATVYVARALFKNGGVFLLDAFNQNAELANSVNHLLVVGFYLINIGYVALELQTNATIVSTRQAIELVSNKIGLVFVVLGVMHFFNLYMFNRMRRRGMPFINRA